MPSIKFTYGAICLAILGAMLYAKPTLAQIDSSAQHNIIYHLAAYRDYLLTQNAGQVTALRKLATKWESQPAALAKLGSWVQNILQAKAVYNAPPSYILKKISQSYPYLESITSLTAEEIELLSANSHLLDMVVMDLLDNKYPYKIVNADHLIEELSLYDIKKGDKVAEIGAGNGSFATLLSLVQDSITIYANELDQELITYISQKIDYIAPLQPRSSILLVKGATKSTHLEHIKVDKIIVKNTFHHFKYKKEMLRAIRKSMHPNSRLFITEPVRDYDLTNNCKKIMYIDAIKNEIAKSNIFRIVREYPFGRQVILVLTPLT